MHRNNTRFDDDTAGDRVPLGGESGDSYSDGDEELHLGNLRNSLHSRSIPLTVES